MQVGALRTGGRAPWWARAGGGGAEGGNSRAPQLPSVIQQGEGESVPFHVPRDQPRRCAPRLTWLEERGELSRGTRARETGSLVCRGMYGGVRGQDLGALRYLAMTWRSPPAVLRRAFKYLGLVSPEEDGLALDVYLSMQKVYLYLSKRDLRPREEKRSEGVASALEV